MNLYNRGMRLTKFSMFALPILCLTFLAAPAKANDGYTSPLSYTTIHNRKNNTASRDEGTMKFMRVEQEEQEKASPPETPEQETPTMRVWRKYKALAAGTPEEQTSDDKALEHESKNRLHNRVSMRASDMPAAPVPAVDQKRKAAESEAIVEAEPTLPSQTTATSAPPPGHKMTPTGFQSILQEYHRAKEQRRSLHSITVTPPTAPQQPIKPTSPAEE